MIARRFLVAIVVWMAVAHAAPAAAQTDTTTLTTSLPSLARLTLSRTTAAFPDADPDTTPQIAATGGAIGITAKARTRVNTQVVLTVRASGDLRSGLSLIPVTNLTWTATGTGFVAGTVSRTAAVTLATWTGSGSRSGTQQLFFRNLWTHPTGIYTVTLTYTLSAP